MQKTTWGIIGPGNIAHNFAKGLAEADSGELIAVAGRNPDRKTAFAETYKIEKSKRYETVDALLADTDVTAIYVATPHPLHAELAIQALRASKHVVVEKPAGLIAGEVVAITEVAAQENRFFMEGMMYRCHPQIARVIALIKNGTIGDLRHITARFGFSAAFDATSRLFDPALAGGAVLDVGLYPLSLVRLLVGVAQGNRFAEPQTIVGTGTHAQSGVDDTAYAALTFSGGITADIACAITLNMTNDAVITGTKGEIRIVDPWVPGRDAGPSDAILEITSEGANRIETLEDPRMLFAFEAELASRTIAAGQTEAPSPAPNWQDSIGNARALDQWRHATGFELPSETPAGLRRLRGTIPQGLPEIPTAKIPGSDRDISKLIVGCDNRDTLAEGAIVWDAWWEAGGNAFDTGFVYGGGRHEALLGDWLTTRGVGKQANVVVKGGHTPYNVPQAISVKLAISLERLQLDNAPVYILHRDNLDVTVGEFVDTLNDLHSQGKIGAFGGSNWSPARLAEANTYAAKHGLKPMTILNNNLSLATAVRPIWPGCVSANDPETLAFLRETNTAHLSWSSQARGYFRDVGDRFELPDDTNPDACFASTDNQERRRRAAELAASKGVHAQNIATAWVLGQSFPSLAIIGPRSPGEIVTTLPALTTELSTNECAWLNLETATL